MAYWIVRQEIEHLDLKAYRDAADKLTSLTVKTLDRLIDSTELGNFRSK